MDVLSNVMLVFSRIASTWDFFLAAMMGPYVHY